MGYGEIWLDGLLIFGGLGTVFWSVFELWLIGSFFWAYIDEKKWQLPKPLEFIFFQYWRVINDNEDEVFDSIRSINHREWCGIQSGTNDIPLGGRACLVSVGYIGRVLTAWIFGLVWPLITAAFSFWFILRSLRFLRRTQKTVGKLVKVAHKHKSDGRVQEADIEGPEF